MRRGALLGGARLFQILRAGAVVSGEEITSLAEATNLKNVVLARRGRRACGAVPCSVAHDYFKCYVQALLYPEKK
jgi:hypothetical protein